MACISITDYYERGRFSRIIYPGKSIFLQFDDVEREHDGYIPMDQKQSEKIAKFVRMIYADESVHTIVVHCEAGISRSAGVAAAILKWWTGDDSPIFDNNYYRPNMRCYRMVLNALLGDLEEIDAGE